MIQVEFKYSRINNSHINRLKNRLENEKNDTNQNRVIFRGLMPYKINYTIFFMRFPSSLEQKIKN